MWNLRVPFQYISAKDSEIRDCVHGKDLLTFCTWTIKKQAAVNTPSSYSFKTSWFTNIFTLLLYHLFSFVLWFKYLKNLFPVSLSLITSFLGLCGFFFSPLMFVSCRQRCVYMDQLAGGGCGAGRLGTRSVGPGRTGNKRGSGRALSHRRCCRHCGPRCYSYQFPWWETTNALERRIFGWPVGSYLRCLQHVKRENHIKAKAPKSRDFPNNNIGIHFLRF